MKRLLPACLIALGLLMAMALPAAANNKIWICHRDQGHPEWNLIQINLNALPAHLGHQWGADIYPVPEGGCPQLNTPTPEPTATNVPTHTPVPTLTYTATTVPTDVPTDIPTLTPAPTDIPTEASTETPTEVPSATETPVTPEPTNTPSPTETVVPRSTSTVEPTPTKVRDTDEPPDEEDTPTSTRRPCYTHAPVVPTNTLVPSPSNTPVLPSRVPDATATAVVSCCCVAPSVIFVEAATVQLAAESFDWFPVLLGITLALGVAFLVVMLSWAVAATRMRR